MLADEGSSAGNTPNNGDTPDNGDTPPTTVASHTGKGKKKASDQLWNAPTGGWDQSKFSKWTPASGSEFKEGNVGVDPTPADQATGGWEQDDGGRERDWS